MPCVFTSLTKRLFLVWKDEGEEEEKLQFVFEYQKPDGKGTSQEKVVAISRPRDEEWAVTRQRVSQRVLKILKGSGDGDGSNKHRAKKSTKEEDVTEKKCLEVNHQFNGLDGEMTNSELFYERRVNQLKIGSLQYEVIRDAPLLEEFAIQLHPLVGCPLMARCKWGKPVPSVSDPPRIHWFSTRDAKLLSTGSVRDLFEKWTHLHTGDVLMLSEDQLGCWMAAAVEISVDGERMFSRPFVYRHKVIKVGEENGEAPDEELIFEARQQLYCSKKLEASSYRIVSYNILADLYLGSSLKKDPQEDLFFPYCPKEYQTAEYRYPLVLRELSGYHADLMFLQEVDRKMEAYYLSKFLAALGYSHLYRQKSNTLNEGLAIAYDPRRFRVLEDRSVYVKDLLSCVTHPENGDVEEWLLEQDPAIYQHFASRQTLLQVAHMECTANGKALIVANIHMPSYKHFTENVRIAQLILCLRHIIREQHRLADSLKSSLPQIIFAGDFNAEPTDDITRLLKEGRLRKAASKGTEDNEWLRTDDGGKDDEREAPSFQSLASFPEYTNYARPTEGEGFAGCLDYIWALPHLHIEMVIPMPRHELVIRYGALPSKIAPSDHIPVICEVQL